METKPFYMSATKITLLLIIVSVIVLNFMQIEVAEPLKSVALMVISFYFWQKNTTNNNANG